MGLKVIQEFPSIKTRIYAHVSDLDVASSYPNTEIVLNISKETTLRELCKIKGHDIHHLRQITLNLTAAKTNSVELARLTMDLPPLEDILADFEKWHVGK